MSEYRRAAIHAGAVIPPDSPDFDEDVVAFYKTTTDGDGRAGLYIWEGDRWLRIGNHLYVQIVSDETTIVLTNQLAAEQFLLNTHRYVVQIDLTNFSEVRLVANKQATAGAAGARLVAKYATAFSTSIGSYANIGVSEVSVSINTVNSILVSDWIKIAAGAKGDVAVTITQIGGDGVLDPVFGAIALEFRS